MTAYDLVPSVDFLSGNVRDRHAKLSRVAEADPTFAKERDALEAVIPKDILLDDIDIRLGVSWMSEEDIEQFIRDVLQISAQVIYSKTVSTWSITPLSNQNTMENKQQFGLQWTTFRKIKRRYDDIFDWHEVGQELDGLELLEMALNLQKPRIKIRRSAEAPLEVSLLLTTQAQSKQDALQAKFADWCRNDEYRAARLERTYNDKFNSIVLKQYDGSFLTLQGMAKEWRDRIFERPYQRNGIAQGILIGGGIFFEVGLGKTAVGIAIARERKRVGNCRKPVILVKKATLRQFARTVQEMYPNAKVLAADEGDLSVNNRQLFMAKIASIDWDFVIMTHEQFGSIPMKIEYTIKFYQNEVDKIEREMSAIYEAKGRSAGKSTAVKAMERRGRTLLKKIEKLEEKKDPGFCWEDLGIDLVIVDEYDCYKNLGYNTKLSNIIGLGSPEGSNRALDFDMKRHWLIERYGPQRLIGMTGTPISNTMGEMWKTMNDFAPDLMAQMGWSAFDAWAAANGDIVEQPEITQAGGIKTRQRFCRFINMPEQLTLFRTFAMVMRAKDAGIQRPIAKRYTVAAKMSPWQQEYSESLIERAMLIEAAMGDDSVNPVQWCPLKWYDKREYDHLRTEEDEYWGLALPDKTSYELWPQAHLSMMMDKRLKEVNLRDWRRDNDEFTTQTYLRCGPHAVPDPEDEKCFVYKLATDNMLRISTAGRMCSLDGRLVHWKVKDDPGIPEAWDELDFPGSKVNQCARRVAGLYRRTRHLKATQVVFCDLSTPKGGDFSVYLMLKRKMMDSGIPEGQIAFIHDYDKDVKRLELFDKMNRGEIAILIGSTEKMGVGVNIQERLIAAHHLDCPWRPRDLEQREGRILRPGNTHKQVAIYTYVTQGSSGNTGFDSFMWQGVQAKLGFLLQILTGDLTIRHMEEDASDSPIFTAAQIKALATGDTRIMEYVGLENDLRRCQSLLQGATGDVRRYKNGTHRDSIRMMERYIDEKNELLDQVEEVIPTLDQWAPLCTGDAFKATILDEEHEGHREVGKAIWKYITEVIEADPKEHCNRLHDIGTYGGLKLRLQVTQRTSTNHKGEETTHTSRKIYILTPWENIELPCVKDPKALGDRIEAFWVGIYDKRDRLYHQIREQQKKIDKTVAELARCEENVRVQTARKADLTARKQQLEIALGITPGADSQKTVSIGEDEDGDW